MSWAFIPRVGAVLLLVLANLQSTANATNEGATPVGKVIDLLSGLVKEVQDEGKREAGTYEKFSCFCKTATEKKAGEITKGSDKIDDLSTSIEEKSSERKQKQEEISKRKGTQESLSKKLDEEKGRCLKEKLRFDSRSADVTKALAGLKDALKSLADSKAAGGSLLELDSSVRESLQLADALGYVPERQGVTAFLQQSSSVDPKDPTYKWHSGGIVAVLKKIQKEFRKNKDQLEYEWKKTDAACKFTKGTLGKDLGNNKDAISKLGEKAEGLGKDIAKAKEDLVSEQTALQDAQAYLRDLTLRCESRAKDWDQRTRARSDELQALTKALEVLKGTVKGADAAANKRALLLSARKKMAKVQKPSPSQAEQAPAHSRTALDQLEDGDSTEIATELTALQDAPAEDEAKTSADLPSGDSADDVAAWLHGGAPSFVQMGTVSVEAMQVSLEKRRQEQVLTLMREESSRLESSTLASLVMRMSGDPFGKVKGLIQQLLERLLQESASEATKKGFCDEQLGKTKQERDYNFEEAKKLAADINILEANKGSLDTEAAKLQDGIKDMKDQLDKAKKIRDDEKKNNLFTIKKATEGLKAVNDAYDVLKKFYNGAAPGAVLLEASPVDEDSPVAPTGEYNGKQGAAKNILGLLQVIISDFTRTLKSTAADEDKSAAEFVQFKQKNEAAVAGSTTSRELDLADSKTTAETIKKKTKDTQFAMDVVDSSLKTLEDLKPTCVDSGRMTFKERTEKREQEVAALKKALCKLDPDGVEAQCK